MKTLELIRDIEDRMVCALEGEVSCLEVLADLKQIEDALAEAKKAILPDAIQELNRYGDKLEDYGFRFERTQSGRYNYSMNPEWVELSNRIKELEKASQDAYKMAQRGSILVDADGCQVVTAEYIPSTPSIKIIKLK